MGWFCLRIGVSDFYHGGGAVGVDGSQTVGFAQAGVGSENMGAAVLAAENGPLAEYRQTVEGGRPVGANHRIGQDPVVEGDVDAVVIPVKGHRLYVDIGIKQFGGAYLGGGAVVQQLLAAGG